MTPARNEQIRELYNAALEQPASERSAFVAQRSAGDPSLRESVELLLSQRDATGVRATVGPPPPSQPDLARGTAVGTYRIDDVLGRGGMGVVYRATDTKLHRSVAIKFLSTSLADSEARRRFQREAETASSLNHPHIVTVYDVGEHDGQQYLVSELVDGGTLGDWLTAERERPWRQSVELLIGVADAIAAAHAAGIVHRDLKPANILIGHNGYAKLADFGLAKLLDDGARRAASSASRAAAPTGVGMVIGTVAYMSPEQAAGRPLDARTDVFSFGVVLYEALAGRRPFEGANDLELLKTIAHGAPPALPAQVPEAVRAIVEKALEKDPAERYQHMQDLVVDLRRAVRRSSVQQVSNVDVAHAPRARGPWLVAGGLALAFVAALVPATRYFLSAPPPAQQMKFAIAAPGYSGGLTISPDGQNIAYVATVNGKPQIWLRPIAALEARALLGTDNAEGPFWSPDSRSLAFFADGKLQKVDLDGGPAQALLTDALPTVTGSWRRGSWSRDGTILFTGSGGGQLRAISRVSAAGGAVTPVTNVEPSREWGHVRPQFLPPDDRAFLFIIVDPVSSIETLAASALGDATATPLVSLGNVPASPTPPSVAYANHVLLYTREGTLFAQHFEPKALALSGAAVAVAENVADVSVSDNGTLVYITVAQSQSGAAVVVRQLTWFDRKGNRAGTIAARDDATNAQLSPDGGRIVFNGASGAADSEIWTIDLARGGPTRRTFEPQNYTATWSPDGTQILFSSSRGSSGTIPNRLYRRAANGTGGDELLYTGADDEYAVPSDWSSDGGYVFFGRTTAVTVGTTGEIWVLPLDGDRTAFPLITKALATGPKLSPDGRWLAYSTDESGTRQIVVQPFPAVNEGKWQVSTNGGVEPRWRRDGRELYYLGLDGSMMAVEVAAGEAFDAGPPTALFNTGVSVSAFLFEYLYDVTADGQRFLVNLTATSAAGAPAGDPPPVPITVVVNGTAALAPP